MASTTIGSTSNGGLVGAQGGVTAIPTNAELTRVSYFNGRLLSAEDLQVEQDYLRALVRLANRAGGAGVVHGFVAALSADRASIAIQPGLALDADGRTLLLRSALTLEIDRLLAAGKVAALPSPIAGRATFGACVPAIPAAPAQAVGASGLYLLTVGFTEGPRDEEWAPGSHCDDRCPGITDARYRVEGLIFRAAPLALELPDTKILALHAGHLRSRVASAYFAREASPGQSLISRAGLRAAAWCLGAPPTSGQEVPLAVFLQGAERGQFLDVWTARRERVEPPPRRYWASRMAMRPWSVYVAQILQFQCQLHELLSRAGEATLAPEPFAEEQLAIKDAVALFARLDRSISGLSAMRARLLAVARRPATASGELVEGGLLELPPAGWLPVDDGSGEGVESQVRRTLGQGLDLRFCVVAPDHVLHALEERQHMERISLVHGLERPHERPEVDILVPGGVRTPEGIVEPHLGWVMFCRRRAEARFEIAASPAPEAGLLSDEGPMASARVPDVPTPEPTSSGAIRSGDILVAGQGFTAWFNSAVRGKPGFVHTLLDGPFRAVFDNVGDLRDPALTLAEFIAFFCIFYNETGGTLRPIAELGGAKYFFETHVPGGKTKKSYNHAPNRLAGDQLHELGVLADPADIELWNGTVWPDSAPAAVKTAAERCDFFKYRGRGLIQTTWRTTYLAQVDPLLASAGFASCDDLSSEGLDFAVLDTPSVYLGMVKAFFQASKMKEAFAKVNQSPPVWAPTGAGVSGSTAYGNGVYTLRCQTLYDAMKAAGYDAR
jgi:hypothetical protein